MYRQCESGYFCCETKFKLRKKLLTKDGNNFLSLLFFLRHGGGGNGTTIVTYDCSLNSCATNICIGRAFIKYKNTLFSEMVKTSKNAFHSIRRNHLHDLIRNAYRMILIFFIIVLYSFLGDIAIVFMIGYCFL